MVFYGAHGSGDTSDRRVDVQNKGIRCRMNRLSDQCLCTGLMEQVSQIDDRLVHLVEQVI